MSVRVIFKHRLALVIRNFVSIQTIPNSFHAKIADVQVIQVEVDLEQVENYCLKEHASSSASCNSSHVSDPVRHPHLTRQNYFHFHQVPVYVATQHPEVNNKQAQRNQIEIRLDNVVQCENSFFDVDEFHRRAEWRDIHQIFELVTRHSLVTAIYDTSLIAPEQVEEIAILEAGVRLRLPQSENSYPVEFRRHKIEVNEASQAKANLIDD